jgi:hypothetical protein
VTNVTVLKAFTMNALNKKITLLFITITILFGLNQDLKAQRLDISGNVSYSRVGNLVTLNAGRVDHYVNPFYYQSGTLYLQLWTCLTPFNGLQTSLGYKVAEATIDPLWAGYFYSNVSQTVPFFAPPDGTYYMVMVLAESDGFQRLTVDWHNFSNTETFGYVPPPPPVVTPPSIVSQPSGLSVTAGASATFSVSANGTSPSYQWYKDGSPISGATGATYAISSTQVSDAGSYTVTVSNTAGSVTSNAAKLTVGPPPPSITSQPLAAQILNAGSTATLSVSASGMALRYQGTKGNTSNPVGGNSSSFTTPSLATNSSYWVRVSNAGESVDSSESVIVVWTQGIRVGDQFSANLSPLTSGGKTLKLVGKLPVGLSLNTNTWQISGIVSGNAGNFTPNIQVIQNKAVLQTISIPISVGNFPTSLLGNYEALLKGQNGAPFGVFKLTTGKNVWTASLETLGQARRTAKGSFVLQQGAESVSIEAKFAATKTAPAIALNFTLDGGSPYLFGTHGAGALGGFKMIDSLATATKPILYNLIMDQGTVDALDKPAGKGWASGSFAKTGIGAFKGMLGDATACSFSLRLSVTGQAILWAQPYANKNSFIGGVVDLVDLVPNANNYEALEPRVSWVKVADSKTLSYPGGFSFENLSVSGSSWLVPATHTALGNSLGWLGGEKCTVRIYGAGLSNESQSGTVKLPTEFTLDKAFKLVAPVNASTVKWSGSILKGTGGFSGSFTLPAGLAANTIAGAGAASGLLLQDDKWGVTTGLGLIKVPISGTKGSFRTAALALEQ